MREIKFRGKRIDNNEWVYGYLVKSEDYIFDYSERIDIPYIIPFDNFNLKDYGEYRVEEKTIGQFTGLYDKNDVEIYEGDIIKSLINTFEIVFKKGCFFAVGINREQEYTLFEEFEMCNKANVNLEVIGNIYDKGE